MIALYVNNIPTLIDTSKAVEERIELEKKKDPSVEIEKQTPSTCGACGSSHFDPREADSCLCHDYY